MLRVYDDCQVNPKFHDDGIYIPTEGRLNHVIQLFRECIIASHKSRSAQRHLSHAMIDYEKRRHLRHYTYVIHPFSTFRYNWNALISVLTAFGLFYIPMHAAFYTKSTVSVPWTIIKNILLFLFCCDILINFLTGYFDSYQSMVQLRPKKIAAFYLRNGFIFDLLGSFPTDVIFIGPLCHHVVARRLMAFSFVFRISSFLTYTKNLTQDNNIRRAVYDLSSTIYWLVISLHWQACLCWIVPIVVVSTTSPESPKNNSWIHRLHLWNETRNHIKYGHCVMRAIATFMHSGFLVCDEPETVEDQTLVVIFQFIGSFIFCILIARVMQFCMGVNSSKLKYQAALAHLSQYMSHKQLPHKTQSRILGYYEFRFQRRFYREQEIQYILSMQMRQEIRMHSCRKLVENVTFFNNLPLSLLSRIVALMKSEIFLTNDLIIKAGQKGNCMYFIASGTVAVYTLTAKEVCHLEDGAHFGEIALVMPAAKRVASVVAVETCKLYRLERADFAKTIHPYPMLWDRIKKIAIERHEKTTILNAQ